VNFFMAFSRTGQISMGKETSKSARTDSLGTKRWGDAPDAGAFGVVVAAGLGADGEVGGVAAVVGAAAGLAGSALAGCVTAGAGGEVAGAAANAASPASDATTAMTVLMFRAFMNSLRVAGQPEAEIGPGRRPEVTGR
jgi:hypothetical protein